MDVVAKILGAGATEFEVEYKNGFDRVFACDGPVGLGVAEYRSESSEAESLRRELYAVPRKGRKITVSGADYLLRVTIFDSFGEDAFRVTIQRS